ncbi:MAG: type IV toxin-antitoxin system AbiEi family antitoxin domain-containing protein [Myxococcaceae bacterium]
MPLEDAMDDRANALIQRLGVFRIRDGDEALIPKHWMYRLQQQGVLRHIQRGLWTDSDHWPDPIDIARAFLRHLPLCLLSALHAHQLWEEPWLLWVGIGHSARAPRSDLPVRYVRMSGVSFHGGVEVLQRGGNRVRAYTLEKTLADCLKFRKAIGDEYAYLAIRQAIAAGRVNRAEFARWTSICRVRAQAAPFLQMF